MEVLQLMGKTYLSPEIDSCPTMKLRFYYQAYIRSNSGGSEKLTPDGPPQWCVRYSPRTPGSFDVTFTITNSSGTFTLKTDSFEASEVSKQNLAA